jgi:uridine kinase
LDFVKAIPDATISCYSIQLGGAGGEYIQLAHAMHGSEMLDNFGTINSEHFNVCIEGSPQPHLRLYYAVPSLTTKKLEMVKSSEELLLEAYTKQKTWSQQLSLDSVASCNKAIMSSQSNQFIQLCEAMHEHQLVNIANRIGGTIGTKAQPGPRLVLIAGPSSSGKTTFAKRLGMTLETTGVRPIVISVDSYYKGWPDIDARGMQYVDWESLDSLNLTLLNEHLISLLAGEEVLVPEYDMKTSMPMEKEHWVKTQLPKGGLIIMEGIHCLNPNLTPRVPKADKLQIMISPLSAVAIDNMTFISSTQVRMMRRMVRDFLFRGRSASATLKQWPGVALGERVNIYPNQNYADIVMNSSLIYETHVLKIYAEPLLRSISSDHGEYAEAQRLLYLLNQLVSLPGTAVPSASLLREFIGGSWYYPFAGQYKTA